MPKPPVDHSQVLSAQVEYPFTNESLLGIHHQHGLKGDPDSFVSDVRLAYRTYRLARDAFVTAKEHHQQFDRLAKSPSKYLKTLRSQELTWLKRAGWNGDSISVHDFIIKHAVTFLQGKIHSVMPILVGGWRLFG